MTDDDLTNRLDQLGREPGPGPDPAFANRLESDLRMMGSEREGLATARPWWQPVILASAALVFVVAGFAALRDRGQDLDVVMTSAEDTVLILADGTAASGAEGIELADGTRIVVGPDGSATVAGVVLGAGTEAVVVGGHIEIVDRSGSVGEDSEGGSGGVGGGGGGNGDEGDGASPTDPDPGSSVPTTSNDRTTSLGPTSTRPNPSRPGSSTTVGDRQSTTSPSSTSTPPSTDSLSTGSGSSTTVPAVDPAVDLVIESIGDGRLRLSWTISGLSDIAGWRVSATTGDRTAVVLVIRDGQAAEATLERLDGSVGYRVVAIGADGEPVAESNLVFS